MPHEVLTAAPLWGLAPSVSVEDPTGSFRKPTTDTEYGRVLRAGMHPHVRIRGGPDGGGSSTPD